MERKLVPWMALLVLGAACGSEEQSPSPAPTPAPGPAEPAEPTPAAEGNPQAGENAPAEAQEQTFEQRAAAAPAVAPTPAAQTAGTMTVTAQVCTLDGPELVGEDSFRAVGPVAVTPDGHLYLIDAQYKVRRYTVQPGEGCALQMDTTLGEGGLLGLGEGLGRRPESITSDARGHVFVSSSMNGTWRITGTNTDYHCQETRGKLTINGQGSVGFALFGSGTPQKVSFTDTGCSVAEWTYSEPFERVDSVTFVGNRVLLGGSDNAEGRPGPHLARFYNEAGAPQGARFGDTTDNLSAADHFCHVHGGVECRAGLCVVDGNCRKVRVFNNNREVQGIVDLMRLLGLRYPWIAGVTPPRQGTAYVSSVQERGQGTRVYQGLVFRVTGL